MRSLLNHLVEPYFRYDCYFVNSYFNMCPNLPYILYKCFMTEYRSCIDSVKFIEHNDTMFKWFTFILILKALYLYILPQCWCTCFDFIHTKPGICVTIAGLVEFYWCGIGSAARHFPARRPFPVGKLAGTCLLFFYSC